jgi:hypothetical protein
LPPLEPAADATRALVPRHRRERRDPARLLTQARYYQARDSLGVERVF